MGLGERGEGAAIKAVHAMPRGANPDVAIPVFRDGVDLVLSQARHVGKGGDRLAVPHAQGTALPP